MRPLVDLFVSRQCGIGSQGVGRDHCSHLLSSGPIRPHGQSRAFQFPAPPSSHRGETPMMVRSRREAPRCLLQHQQFVPDLNVLFSCLFCCYEVVLHSQLRQAWLGRPVSAFLETQSQSNGCADLEKGWGCECVLVSRTIRARVHNTLDVFRRPGQRAPSRSHY